MSRRRRVSVHVGLPKSGTTFLQSSLVKHVDALRACRLLYPFDPRTPDRMFLAALDVREQYDGWGRTQDQTRGSWRHLAKQVRAFDGDSVLSHELLSAASAKRATWALARLKGLEVHVVVTVRDPARQAIAEWQEGIKHGRRLSFRRFTRKVLAPAPGSAEDTDHARRFRASQDLPAVLERWAADLPPEHVHLVTCPPRGTSPAVLWGRFGDAVGFDAEPLEPAGKHQRNGSLGVPEIDLLRRVNKALDGRLRQPSYGQVVKEIFAQDLLSRLDSPRPVLPARLRPELTMVAERWTKEIQAAGWTVHGDLDDLVPQAAEGEPGAGVADPDDVDPEQQVRSAVSVTADLLVELAGNREQVTRLTEENARLRRKRRGH